MKKLRYIVVGRPPQVGEVGGNGSRLRAEGRGADAWSHSGMDKVWKEDGAERKKKGDSCLCGSLLSRQVSL